MKQINTKTVAAHVQGEVIMMGLADFLLQSPDKFTALGLPLTMGAGDM